MNRHKANVYVIFFLQCAVVLVALFAALNTRADDKSKQAKNQPAVHLISSLKGDDLFRAYCASCHGADGKGQGPVAPALAVPLPDLTLIAQKAGGVFPDKRVRRIISGEDTVVAHGSREMPVWGPIFHQVEEDRDFGEVRLQNVTDYLKSIQQK